MTLAIDLDGVICTEEKTFEKPLALPIPGAVEAVNWFFDEGHTVLIWTARGWEQYRMTIDWLSRNGFRFHSLLMGKPIVDYFIDDRAISFTDWATTRSRFEKS